MTSPRPCPTPDKLAYATLTVAVAGAAESADLFSALLWPYQCRLCRAWHLTRQRRSDADLAALAATDEGTAALLELDRIHRTALDARLPLHRDQPRRR